MVVGTVVVLASATATVVLGLPSVVVGAMVLGGVVGTPVVGAGREVVVTAGEEVGGRGETDVLGAPSSTDDALSASWVRAVAVVLTSSAPSSVGGTRGAWSCGASVLGTAPTAVSCSVERSLSSGLHAARSTAAAVAAPAAARIRECRRASGRRWSRGIVMDQILAQLCPIARPVRHCAHRSAQRGGPST